MTMFLFLFLTLVWQCVHWIVRVKLGFAWWGANVIVVLGFNFYPRSFGLATALKDSKEYARLAKSTNQSDVKANTYNVHNSTRCCLVSATDPWNSMLVHYWCLDYSHVYLDLLWNFISRRKAHYHCDGLLPRSSSIRSLRLNQSESGSSFFYWL